MAVERALLVFLALGPFAHAAALLALARTPSVRDLTHVALSALTALGALAAFAMAADGARGMLVLAQPFPHAALAIELEPLGAAFAALSAGAGGLVSVFAVGRGRALGEADTGVVQALSALGVGLTIACALSENLLAFFVFYCALGLVAFPIQTLDRAAPRAVKGVSSPGLALGLALCLLLPAIVWAGARAGGYGFAPGGVLAGRLGPGEADALLALTFFGLALGGAAPLYGWALEFSRVRAPLAALSLAATFGLAGGLGLIKIVGLGFGPALAEATLVRPALAGLAAASLVYLSLRLLRAPTLRLRLGFLAAGQFAAVTLGVLLDTPLALLGAALQLAAHVVTLLALLLPLGAVEAATERTRPEELGGLARRMPLTFLVFTAGAFSAAGAPPLAGAWPRLWLAAGSVEGGWWPAALTLLLFSVCVLLGLGAPAARAVLEPAPGDPFTRPDGTSLLIIAPAILAGIGGLVLTVFLDPLAQALSQGLGVRP